MLLINRLTLKQLDQVPQGTTPRSLVVHLRGGLTRSCKPGDAVSISGAFLPEPYTGFRAMKAGLLTSTFLDAMRVVQLKQSYKEHALDKDLQERMQVSLFLEKLKCSQIFSCKYALWFSGRLWALRILYLLYRKVAADILTRALTKSKYSQRRHHLELLRWLQSIKGFCAAEPRNKVYTYWDSTFFSVLSESHFLNAIIPGQQTSLKSYSR